MATGHPSPPASTDSGQSLEAGPASALRRVPDLGKIQWVDAGPMGRQQS